MPYKVACAIFAGAALSACTEELPPNRPADLSACLAAPVGVPFALADAVPTQVNLDIVTHDGVIWTAYNGAAVDGSSDLDVYVARLGCDQTLLGPPSRASTAEATLDGDVSIAVNGDGALVAWLADDRAGANNLSIRTRAYAIDGTPMAPAETRLPIMSEGELTSTWLPRVVSAGVGFWLAGTQAVPSAETFQVFVHRLSQAGQLSGVLSSAPREAGILHTNPDVHIDEQSRMQLVFERDVNDIVRLGQGVFVGESLAITQLDAGDNAARPRWAKGSQDSSSVQVWGANTGPAAVSLRLETAAGELVATVGDASRRNLLPAAAMRGRTGVVAWHEAISGTTSKVLAAPFTVNSGGIVVGAVREIAPLALSYGPAIAHVVEDTYVIGWTLTSAGDRKAMGMFVNATPP